MGKPDDMSKDTSVHPSMEEEGIISSSKSGEGILYDEINRFFDNARRQIKKIDGEANNKRRRLL